MTEELNFKLRLISIHLNLVPACTMSCVPFSHTVTFRLFLGVSHWVGVLPVLLCHTDLGKIKIIQFF